MLSVNILNAQQFNDLNSFFSLRKIQVEIADIDKLIIIDTLSIVPASVSVFDKDEDIIDTSFYSINYINAELLWKKPPPSYLITIQYRVFNFDFTKKYRHKNIIQTIPSPMSTPQYTYEPEESVQDIFGSDLLHTSGSLSRGITIGNSQNLSVNSELNLQINGMLNENIGIKAAITDKNVPIQPDGTTLQLQEFDQVYIQLFTKTDRLQIGDFIMQGSQDNYFLKNHKKAQGLSLSSSRNFGAENLIFDNNISFAISKGRYSRNTFQGSEGGQGPYRLSAGGANEFVYIISGTEKVYVNGKELTRGEFNDYIINYNLAEITFTSNVPITANSRIIVEYQYANFNYLRSAWMENSTVKSDRWTFRFNIYSEQDHKNRPLLSELNENEILLLMEAGPEVPGVYTYQFDSSVYMPERIMYRKTDTLGYTNIFVHSNDPDEAIYLVSFTNVGTGMGNYIQVQSLANGRVFKWIEPVNNIPQGNYEPVREIIAPEKQQLYSLAAEYEISNNVTAGSEFALSNNISNTFSEQSNLQNPGLAVSTFVKTIHNLSSQDIPWTISSNWHHEYADVNFRPVERYRPVEFERIWNRSLKNIPAFQSASNENWANLKINLDKTNRHSLHYKLSTFFRDTGFSGIQNEISALTHLNNFRINLKNEITNVSKTMTDTTFMESNFIYRNTDIAYMFPFITAGMGYEEETAIHQFENENLLQLNSFKYHEYRFYLENPDTSVNSYLIQYSQRNDYFPILENFLYSAKEEAVELRMRYRTGLGNQLNWNVYLRNTEPVSPHSNIEKEVSLLNRTDYNYSYQEGFVNGRFYYETGSGQEQKRDFFFIQVLPGQGSHIWIDYNENGIKERNEFEPAPFPEEADHIKVPIPSGDYVRSLTNNFNKNLEIDPYKQWSEKSGLKKTLSTFISRTMIQINRKNIDDGSILQYIPIRPEIDDTMLITTNSNIRQSLDFNRRHPKFGISLNWFNNSYKQLLVYDIESHNREEVKLDFRWNINRQWSLFPEIASGTVKNTSNAVPERNYVINYQKTANRINYQPNTRLRLSCIYEYYIAQNTYVEQFENIQRHHITTEATISRATKSHINLRAGLIFIEFDGETITPAGFEVLQGYQNGTNSNWSAVINHQLQKNLQLSFRYDGRKPAGSEFIHTGRVMLRYLF